MSLILPMSGWNSCGAPKVHQVASGAGGRDAVSDLKLPSRTLLAVEAQRWELYHCSRCMSGQVLPL